LHLPSQAAQKEVKINHRVKIIQNCIRPLHKNGKKRSFMPSTIRYENRTDTYVFKAEIISDNQGIKRESFVNSASFVAAKPEERYAVRLYNPLPVRVAVNLSIDGLNSISGKPSGIADGNKWVIEPHSYVTIRGWQIDADKARRFFFTNKQKSYAAWRSSSLDQDLSANCGVIGAAFFWSSHELEDYFEQHPISEPCHFRSMHMKNTAAEAAYAEHADTQASSAENQKAGTGMGEKESHPTVQVRFDYDKGMYSVDDALLIYYDFVKQKHPHPFPGTEYAPEMP
jgi:hypothetical protein